MNTFYIGDFMQFIKDYFKGVAIGSGAILPGISSGVLCVIFGIYEKLLDSILNFFKNIKENFKFLFPIMLGIVSGIILFSNILNYLFYSYPIQIKSIFIGLILGSIPSILKSVNSKYKFKLSYILYLLISFGIGIFLIYLENKLSINSYSEYSFFYLILCGILMSIGVVIPGISSTIILMLMGVYSTYLYSISTLYFPILIPLGIGLVIGSFICMKLVKILFDKFYAQTFYLIVGFTLGSIFILFPHLTGGIDNIICILCISIGFFIINLIN